MRSRLKRKIPAFGLALVASLALCAFAAAGASALSFSSQPSVPGPSFNISTSNSVFESSGGDQIVCQSAGNGTGNFVNETAGGSAQFTFNKCGRLYGWQACASTGSPSGTILTESVATELVYLDAAKTQFGMKLSPKPGGTIAKFNCGGRVYVWTGSVLGRITSPALGVTAASFTLSFATSASGQEYEQVEGAGSKLHLYQQVNGAALEDLTVKSTFTNAFNGGVKGKFNP